jgi:BASS family bile acid:Na+ symporter
MSRLIDSCLIVVTLLAMLVVGLEVRARGLAALGRIRWSFLLGLGGQLLFVPPLAAGIVIAFRLPAEMAGGLLLLAACPVGGIVSFYTLLARANVALAVAITLASCALSTLSMPLIAQMCRPLVSEGAVWPAPSLVMILRIGAAVLLPLLAGLYWRHLAPRLVVRFLAPLRSVTTVAILLVLGLVMWDQRAWLGGHWVGAVLASTVFLLGSGSCGWVAGRVLGCGRDDAFAVAATWAVRHVALAAMIGGTILKRPELAAFASAYFLCQAPLMLALAALFRRAAPRAKSENQGTRPQPTDPQGEMAGA